MREEASTSSQDLSINKEPIVLIEHNEQTHVENIVEDDNEAPRESKRQRIAKSSCDDFLYTSWMTHLRPLKRHFHLLMLTIGRKQ
jgi:hypothetical protein